MLPWLAFGLNTKASFNYQHCRHTQALCCNSRMVRVMLMIFLFLLSFFRSPWWFRFRRALRSLYLKRDGKKNKWNIKTDSPPTPATADNFRPYLSSFQGNSFTDYINAVFVDVSTPHLCLPRWVGKMGTPKYIIIHLCSFASRCHTTGLHETARVHRHGMAAPEDVR